ncbi:hypothetical protein ACIQGZ_02620 [Streptomyces sp. NPDC092296]|uniref:hypothetical protein n=1 Tax=Streptomyces sp. NPDC092296 TaxID=3366012 RepID=UPI00382B77CC
MRDFTYPSTEDLRDYLTETSKLAASTPQDSAEYAGYHAAMNEVLDQMRRDESIK